jgi:hypothetical protein
MEVHAGYHGAINIANGGKDREDGSIAVAVFFFSGPDI